ncbi:MAG: DNA-processing protein DprA [Alphaproteobacteria bacterium]|jgi:DNA processing protein|nr:DNA-processing protein DprA [Alphaproteobacteria bacterium]
MRASGGTLSRDERRDWLRLIRSENVGPIGFFQLLERFGTAAAAIEALPELARRGGRRRLRLATLAEVEQELAAVEAAGAGLIAFSEPGYPPLLREIADPPPLISVLGHPALLGRETVAVVGARNASASGQRFARQLAAEIAAAGLNVVSGMARGTDAAAHAGALAHGTIAVLAGGVDVIYPPENEALYHDIVAGGAVISEMPVGTKATARHFPRRNRLISGLALGVVVVEAAPRSGSLITARLAAEQGREVFAVPGSPLDPRARGANGLIRQGAQLTESAADVIDAVQRMRERRIEEPRGAAYGGRPTPPAEAELDQGRQALVRLLGPTPVEVDELIRQSELTPPVVITILLELDLAGRLDRHPGNRVSLR